MKPAINIFWFRRDLRLHDNAGLYYALKENNPVVPVFIFDRNMLDELLPEQRIDRRVEFIYRALQEMQGELDMLKTTLDVRYGFPAEIFNDLLADYRVQKVFTNHDYEPYASARDNEIKELLHNSGVQFHTFRDQVIFERDEIVKDDGNPYTVFTPYSKKWKSLVRDSNLKGYPTEKYFHNFYKQDKKEIPSLRSMGFTDSNQAFPPKLFEKEIIKHYAALRDIPSIKGTSCLSVHLRFGTISIRKLAKTAMSLSETFLNELIWREFY